MFIVVDASSVCSRYQAWYCDTASLQFVCTPLCKQHVLSVHAVVVLLAFLIFLLVLGFLTVWGTLLWLVGCRCPLQLLQPRFDFIHQPNAVVVLNHTIAGLGVFEGGARANCA